MQMTAQSESTSGIFLRVSQHVLLQVQSGGVYRGKAIFVVVGRMRMIFLATGSPLLEARLIQFNRTRTEIPRYAACLPLQRG
jgi:hypothetical protein